MEVPFVASLLYTGDIVLSVTDLGRFSSARHQNRREAVDMGKILIPAMVPEDWKRLLAVLLMQLCWFIRSASQTNGSMNTSTLRLFLVYQRPQGNSWLYVNDLVPHFI